MKKQYINKSSIITEIRKLLHNAEAYLKYHHNKNDELVHSFKHQKLTMCELLSFIDSLEVKEVDLEKEIEKYLLTNAAFLIGGDSKLVVHHIARYFFELGLKTKGGEK